MSGPPGPERIVAVDPGFTGALAFFERVNEASVRCVDVVDMPLRYDTRSRKPHVDGIALAKILREHLPLHLAVIEGVGAAPGQGLSSTFRFGQGAGVVDGVCCGVLGLQPAFVSPAGWRNAVGLPAGLGPNERKAASLSRARLLFPHKCDVLSRAKDHGRADAMLIGVGWLRLRGPQPR